LNESQSQIFEEYIGLVCKVARDMRVVSGTDSLTEEMVTEAISIFGNLIVTKWDHFDGDLSGRVSWLSMMIRWKLLDWLRTNKRFQGFELHENTPAPRKTFEESLCLLTEDAKDIVKFIASLPVDRPPRQDRVRIMWGIKSGWDEDRIEMAWDELQEMFGPMLGRNLR
jgi:hypothetical protein